MVAWLSRRQPERLWLWVFRALCCPDVTFLLAASNAWMMQKCLFSLLLCDMFEVHLRVTSCFRPLVWGQEVQPSITDRSRDAFACSSSVFNVHVHLEAMHGCAPSSQHQRFAGSTSLWLDEPEWRRLLGWISSFLCSTRPPTTSLHHHHHHHLHHHHHHHLSGSPKDHRIQCSPGSPSAPQ